MNVLELMSSGLQQGSFPNFVHQLKLLPLVFVMVVGVGFVTVAVQY